MKLMNKSLVFVLMGMLLFAACKKDNPTPTGPNNLGGTNNPPAPTNTELISAKPWKLTSSRLIEQGQTDTTNVNIIGSADWRFTFAANGTGSILGTFLNSGEMTWAFAASETRVDITKAGSAAVSYNYTTTTLKRTLPNVTLTLLDANGNPVGTVTGTVLEAWEKMP